MSADTYTQEINVSNILTLNFTYIEEKLKKNFQIIAKRLSKLQGLFSVEQKIKGMERQAKFLSMKLDNVIMKIPEISMGVSPQTVKIICDEQMKQYMNSTHDNLKTTRFYHEIKDAVTRGLRDQTKIPPPVALPVSLKKKQKNEKVKDDYQIEKIPLKHKINREDFIKQMTKQQIHFTDKILKQDKSAEELILEVAVKLRIFIRDYEQTRIAKGSLGFVNQTLDKFEQFQSYESRFSSKKGLQKDKTRTRIQRGKDNPEESQKKYEQNPDKLKQGELQKRQDKTAIKIQRQASNLKRITSKNHENSDMNSKIGEQAQYKSRSAIKINTARYQQFPKVDESRTKKKSIIEEVIFLPENQDLKYNHNDVETSKKEYRSTVTKMQSKKSLARMLIPQFDKDPDNNKNLLNSLRHLQKSIDQKVSKDVFLNVVEELEQKLQCIKHAKDISDTAQIKKFCTSVQNRMQSIIAFIQQLQDEEDPIIAKKKWSCISCDRQAQKYTAKVGSHLSWDSLNGRKLSPVKAGAFGQTVMFASKVRNLINIGDIPE